MQKKPIVLDPKAAPGNFSPAIQAGPFLFVSGQVGSEPGTGKIPANFEDEVRQTFRNIEATLKAGGATLADAVAVQVYLTDMELFQRMNVVYREMVPEPRPARTTVGVSKLVGTAKIEVTVTAFKPGGMGMGMGGGRGPGGPPQKQ